MDAGSNEDAGPTPDGGPPKRTIALRNPWGGPAGNLLVDGDPELSTVHAGDQPQSGWWTFTGSGSTRVDLRFETGGLCRTGLRCAVLEPGRMLVGMGVAAREAGMVATLWAKGPAGMQCDDVLSTYVVDFSQWTISGYLKPTAPDPGSDGWCQYRGSFSEKHTQQCLFVDSKLASGETALVDSARLEPETGTVPPQSAVVVSPALAARVRAAVDYITRHRMTVAPERDGPPGALRGL